MCLFARNGRIAGVRYISTRVASAGGAGTDTLRSSGDGSRGGLWYLNYLTAVHRMTQHTIGGVMCHYWINEKITCCVRTLYSEILRSGGCDV